ncbi:MAG TPA: glucosaminidase domain-containing protein [Acidimicrobiales bacterium]
MGAIDQVRADIAFAQAVLETGYFVFPAGGQLTPSDNNFAGIGACDGCVHGYHFPDAQTGVAAHLQLLHEYATTQPIPGPLTGPVGVSGCCPTWMTLTGKWASAVDYGYAILNVYRHMLEWALSQRATAAGL